jgi:hypothetical protein
MNVTKLIENCRYDEAIDRISLVFNQCSLAHRLAGTSGIEMLKQKQISSQQETIRRVLAKTEALQQLLWLLMVDIPRELEIEAELLTYREILVAIKQSQNDLILELHSDKPEQLLQYESTENLHCALKTCQSFLLAGSLSQRIQEALLAIDWPAVELVNQSIVNQDIGGSLRREHALIEQSTCRLLGLFDAIISDTQKLLTNLIQETGEVSGTAKQIKRGEAHDDITIGTVSNIAHNQTSNSAQVSIETARGVLSHSITLSQQQGDVDKVHDWRFEAPTKMQFSKGGIASLLLEELLEEMHQSEQFQAQAFSRSTKEQESTRTLHKQASVLLKLLNPCYQANVCIENNPQYHPSAKVNQQGDDHHA